MGASGDAERLRGRGGQDRVEAVQSGGASPRGWVACSCFIRRFTVRAHEDAAPRLASYTSQPELLILTLTRSL
jgi:hypothetical protein